MTTATAAPAKERSNGKAPGRYYRTGMSYEELFDMYPTERSAEKWLEEQRWGKVGLYCPRCGCVDRCTKTPKQSMPYWCGACRRRFSVRIGTLLERSHVPYRKWVVAIYLHLSNLKGVSSVKLARDLKVTQKTAWFMLHRIRRRSKIKLRSRWSAGRLFELWRFHGFSLLRMVRQMFVDPVVDPGYISPHKGQKCKNHNRLSRWIFEDYKKSH